MVNIEAIKIFNSLYKNEKNLKKELELRLGKKLFRHSFNFSINLHLFERCLEDIIKLNKHSEIKKYNVHRYYDYNKVLTIFNDGTSYCHKISRPNKIKNKIKSLGALHILYDITDLAHVNSDEFEPSLIYDNIKKYDNIIFVYGDFSLIFMKINEENSNEQHYEIKITITNKLNNDQIIKLDDIIKTISVSTNN